MYFSYYRLCFIHKNVLSLQKISRVLEKRCKININFLNIQIIMKQIACFRNGNVYIFAMSDEKERFVLFKKDSIEGIKKESKEDLLKAFNNAVFDYLKSQK